MTFRAKLSCAVALSAASLLAADGEPKHPAAAGAAIPKVELYFEPNLGQIPDPTVSFLARGGEMTALFRGNEAILQVARRKPGSNGDVETAQVHMRMIGARPTSFEPVTQADGVSAYYQGSDPAKWLQRVPHYSRIVAREVYPGIDAVFYSNGPQLEYDFIVKPGANPSNINLSFAGTRDIRPDGEGGLWIDTTAGDIRQKRPLAYQQYPGGARAPIAARYQVRGDKATFSVGNYDAKLPLVIDPVLEYSTLLPGWGQPMAMAIDPSGACYVTGVVGSVPVVNPIYPPQRNDYIFVSKFVFNPTTKALSLAYSTFIPGPNSVVAIAADAQGSAYVLGGSSNGLTYVNPMQLSNEGSAWLAKITFNPVTQTTGLAYATPLPGIELRPNALAVDSSGAAHITGHITNYNGQQTLPLVNALPDPGPIGDFEPNGFAMKVAFDAGAQRPSLGYATLIGGYNNDAGVKIAVDANGGIYVAGETHKDVSGRNFPVLNPITQNGSVHQGFHDIFVFKMLQTQPGPLSLQYSTLIGSPNFDNVHDLRVDAGGGVALVGSTSNGTDGLPLVNPLPGGTQSGSFIARLVFNANQLSLAYCTRMTSSTTYISSVDFDGAGNAWIAGGGPLSASEYLVAGGSRQVNGDSYLARLSFTGNALSLPFTTRVPSFPLALRIDSANNMYIAGPTDLNSAQFPELNALTPASTSTNTKTFVMRIAPGDPPSSSSTLSVTRTGNGTIVSTGGTGGQINCGSACTATISGNVTLTATPDPGYMILAWDGACLSQNLSSYPNTNSCSLTMNGAKAVGVQFAASVQFTAGKIGTGSGRITGNGIDCGSTCVTNFPASAIVRMTATPDAGSKFLRWISGCNTTTPTCDVVIGPNASARAEFVLDAPPPSGNGLYFYPLTPCRMIDTRLSNGALGSPNLAGLATRSFSFSQSNCNVPARAAAFALNITVVPKGPLAYLTVFPTGQTLPTVSTLNSLDGRIKGAAAIVPAGNAGEVSFYATNPTELIVDINGYFAEQLPGIHGQLFYPLPPCRITDTRNPTGPLGGPAMSAVQTRTFDSAQSACAITGAVRGLSLNVTVVPRRPLAYVSIFPASTAQPNVSTLNALLGQVVANAAVTNTNGGRVDVYSTDPTELILDVNGYFSDVGEPNGLRFYPVTPCRISDSRSPTGTFGGPILNGLESRIYPVPQSACGIPSTARAYSLSATVVPPSTGLGYLTLFPEGQTLPTVSTLNAVDGSITSNAAIVPAGVNGAIRAYVSQTSHLILDINGYFAP